MMPPTTQTDRRVALETTVADPAARESAASESRDASRWKRYVINFVKYGVSLAIIVWLIQSTRQSNPEVFARLTSEPKDWTQMTLALAFCMAGVILTFVRWYYLVRAVELPFTIRDAFRLGFLGFFCNFFSLGSVGGDLFKAIFVAREHPEQRATAVATVVIDRIIGLYALFVLSTISILMTGLYRTDIDELQIICQAAFLSTAVGAAGIGILLIPGITSGRLSHALSQLPKVGPIVGKLVLAVRMYRNRMSMVYLALLISLGVHSSLAIGIYFISQGLPGAAPGLPAHFVAVPLAMLTGALPLPVSGLGAFEAAIEFLFLKLPVIAAPVGPGKGLLVALTYRLITILIALVGACYYFTSRRELAAVMHEVEAQAEPLPAPAK